MASTLAVPALAEAPAERRRTGKRITFAGATPFQWLFVILGGLPFFLPALLWLGERGLSVSEPIYWYFWVNAAISAPHVYSTYARLGRKIREGKVSWWFGLPLYAAFFTVLAVASRQGRLVEALTVVNLWQSLHYCRQVYGVSRFVARSATEDRRERRLGYLAYHLAIPLFVLGRWNVLFTVWRGQASNAIIPVHVPAFILAPCWALAAAGVVVGIAAQVVKRRRSGAPVDAAALVTLATYYGVHAFGFLSVRFYQRGFFAVTIFHAVQYLALVWTMEKARAGGIERRLLDAVPSVVSFPLFWAAFFLGGYVLENVVFAGGNRVWSSLAAVGLAAVSAHHYGVDTVMWRRKAGP